ncbi:MAG: hypothetical protein JWO63_1545, partial [Frankiales bacterium]|nr:hypothetical protein [Frankiales bacterium]
SGASTVAGSYNLVTPKRLLDTRTGLGAKKGAVVTGVTVSLPVTGLAGVPATGVRAVVLTVTETEPTVAGSVTVWADRTALPPTSNLNFAHGATVPNLVIAQVGADGKVSIRMSGNGSVELLADVSGYIR